MATRAARHACQALWRILVPVCMAPTEQEWKTIEEGFIKRANFPDCVGPKGNKHVGVIERADIGSQLYNFKSYFSVLLGVSDSNYNFTFVDIGSYGNRSDSSVCKTHFC
jgi:hypothetical protein